jgi:SNF2 family DNA or RNA helicase
VAITCESKLRALLKELTKMRAADESHKALVFSQFIGTLEWLKTRLPEEGFSYRTISGSMPLPQRAKAIQAFQADPPTTVFLLSVRSGAVGINLTSASHVFVLEPLLNPALEAQAIGRAWRMGQTRSVKVIHFVTKDSVEERIVELNAQRAKAKGANEGGNAAAELAKKKGKQRITVTEVAGAIRADKQDLRAEELQLLFS